MSDDVVKFTINGKEYQVGAEDAIDLTLEPFLFNNKLRGARVTCFEGGCGACTVVATETDPNTGVKRTFPVHSCLASVYGCNGWEITTIEGLGNQYDGYNKIQDKLVEKAGTQCGWCSPGMVMNMYGLTQGKTSWTQEEVEKHLDGNLCRCTGYRPILDAFKSITPEDIEDIGKLKCGKTGGCCKSKTAKKESSGCCKDKKKSKEIAVAGLTWYQPTTLQELFSVLSSVQGPVTIVSGNTGHGVFWENPTLSYINIRAIPEMSAISSADSSDGLQFGANVSITSVLEELDKAALVTGYAYAAKMAEHWRHIGSVALRNLGSWAGNLAMKNRHQEFQSDVFITLVAAQATVEIGGEDGSTAWMSIEEMLSVNLMEEKKVLLNLKIPSLPEETVYRSFKITPRAVNCHAHVNAAFAIRVDATSNSTVIDKPVLAFGAISSDFVRATATEDYLMGKSLEDSETLTTAMDMLGTEVIPEEFAGEASPEYRKSLCQSLFYRTIIGIVLNKVSPQLRSGADDLERPLSSGTQEYDTNPDMYPLSEPVEKLEAYAQVSGEATFTKDTIEDPDEHHGFFVQSTKANAKIDNIDLTKALEVEGVVGFIGLEDITGSNNIQVMSDPLHNVEPLFPEGRVSYHGQPIGLIVANDQHQARIAASLVQVTYSDEQRPVLTIEEALQNPLPPNQVSPIIIGDVDTGFSESTTIITGTMHRNAQYHFPMESQSVRVVPQEDGLDIVAASQWPAELQASVAQVLGINANSVNVSVKRIGGAFGSKIDRCNIVSTATALAARKFRKPVRTVLDFGVNMSMLGWRDPFYCEYKAGVDENGILKAVEITLTSDAGYVAVDASSPLAILAVPSCYKCDNWKIVPQIVVTNTACNTWCRTPGTFDGIIFIETVLEHIATKLGVDKLELRKKNFIPDGLNATVSMGTVDIGNRFRASCRQSKGRSKTTLPVNLINQMVAQMEQEADVAVRKTAVANFNTANRWQKKGIAVQPMLWPYEYPLAGGFNVLISIYGTDGTVAISHGGIELGQGINTKVAQVAAYELGCPLDMVSVKPTNTLTGANSLANSGSLGSYSNIYCVQQAAQKLRARLDNYSGATWIETVQNAQAAGADLTDRHWNSAGELVSYGVFGVACTEVILDVLTGKFIVLRVDILEDAGNLTSPLLDVGQIEGGFVMGQGALTSEKPIYDAETGRRISNTTWFYYPPSALDIPADFRIKFLKDAPNPSGVYSSKVVSEPGVCLSYSVPLALRNAVESARHDAGESGWFTMDCPLTVENLHSLCLVDPSQFKLTT